MSDRPDGNRSDTRDRGEGSPGSREAAEQTASGMRGAQQGSRGGQDRQPPQGSDRAPAARHQQPPEVTKHFAEGSAPSEQGEKEHRSPEVIKARQQGIGARGGSHADGPDRSEERAQRGEPDSDHARHGRQETPGHRPGHRS